MTYFRTLFEEKGIDTETGINLGEGIINFTIENVLEFIENSPLNLQRKIRNKYIQIDFKNGDIMDFTKYLAEKISTTYTN